MDLWPIPLKNGQFLKPLMYIMYSKMANSSQKWPIPLKNCQFKIADFSRLSGINLDGMIGIFDRDFCCNSMKG